MIKKVYKGKMENRFQWNNLQDMWLGMKAIKDKGNQPDGSLDRDDEQFSHWFITPVQHHLRHKSQHSPGHTRFQDTNKRVQIL